MNKKALVALTLLTILGISTGAYAYTNFVLIKESEVQIDNSNVTINNSTITIGAGNTIINVTQPLDSNLTSQTLTDDFNDVEVNSTKWIVNLGYNGSSVTQNQFLMVNDKSMYPFYSSVTSYLVFNQAVINVDFCMLSPASTWAEVQVMLSDSATNQFGPNIQEVFIRKGNYQFVDGSYKLIDNATADSLNVFYQTRYLGSWGNEVLIVKNVTENTWYHLTLVSSDKPLEINVTQNNNLVGSFVSTQGPITANFRVVLGVKSQSTDYVLTGAFDNLSVTSPEK